MAMCGVGWRWLFRCSAKLAVSFTIPAFILLLFCHGCVSAELRPDDVYNAIESEVLKRKDYEKLDGSIGGLRCGTRNPSNYQDKYYAECQINAYTECNDAGESDGVWGWPASRIFYINYMSRFAREYKIPDSIIEPHLRNLKHVVVMNIAEKLNGLHSKKALEGEVTSLGYNDDLVRSGEVASNIEREIINSWEKYRLSQSASRKIMIPKMSADPAGCAGEIPVRIYVKPDGWRLYMIGEFDWMFCLARNVDPWSIDSCPEWVGILSDKILLSGRYRFIADWPSGRSIRSALDTNYFGSISCPTITIDQSERKSPPLITPQETTPCPDRPQME